MDRHQLRASGKWAPLPWKVLPLLPAAVKSVIGSTFDFERRQFLMDI